MRTNASTLISEERINFRIKNGDIPTDLSFLKTIATMIPLLNRSNANRYIMKRLNLEKWLYWKASISNTIKTTVNSIDHLVVDLVI
jgi:hypothetical protein